MNKHYLVAERIAEVLTARHPQEFDAIPMSEEVAVALAQVHATLALASVFAELAEVTAEKVAR